MTVSKNIKFITQYYFMLKLTFKQGCGQKFIKRFGGITCFHCSIHPGFRGKALKFYNKLEH